MSDYKQISCGVPQGSVKYLGIIIDSHLNWKSRVNYVSTKIKRNISILSKIRHCVNLKTLTNLYNSLLYLFLIYGITVWGNTYKSTLASISFSKKILRIIIFSNYCDHSNPLFKALKIVKFEDIIFHIMQYLCMISILALYHKPSPIISHLPINSTSIIQVFLYSSSNKDKLW